MLFEVAHLDFAHTYIYRKKAIMKKKTKKQMVVIKYYQCEFLGISLSKEVAKSVIIWFVKTVALGWSWVVITADSVGRR